MDTRNILISIKGIYAQRIELGRKCVELRKIFPVGKEGCRVYIYVPTPSKKIIGYFYIEKINTMPINNLWHIAGKGSSLSKEEFFAYFSGKKCGVSIHFREFTPLKSPLSLDDVRKIYPEFHPPQSFVYINEVIEGLLLEKQKVLTSCVCN